jgi:hypothetical protein
MIKKKKNPLETFQKNFHHPTGAENFSGVAIACYLRTCLIG